MDDVRAYLRRGRSRLGRFKRQLFPASWPPTLDPAAPLTPAEGDCVAPPDFVGIGAPRAGSTWLMKLIGQHPDVRRQPWGKELHFFDRYFDEVLDAPARYHAYFPRSAGQVTGEWTPGYMYLPWARPLLARTAPRALVLVSLRDPIEQLISSINYSVYHGAPRNGITVSRHLGEAAYAAHLAPWDKDVGDRMVVIQSEAAFDDPVATVHSIWDRLGLDPDHDVNTQKDRNEARESTIRLTDETRRALIDLLEPDVVELASRYPHVDPARWPHFSYLG